MALNPSFLRLEDGSIFPGFSPEWQQEAFSGETVFTTGMTGYCESLTDPSFSGQLLTFTYPLIGNYGVSNESEWESSKIQVAGVIMNEICEEWDHYASSRSLLSWLKKERIPLITGIDTRALTKKLREAGVMLGAITIDPSSSPRFIDPNQQHLVRKVSTLKVSLPTSTEHKKIIAVDCGIKRKILETLSDLPVTIQRVPYDYDYTEEEYDGLFLSNGPGNPEKCPETIQILQKGMRLNPTTPIFGICLGSQLLAIATGASTYKLPYGHRGHNHPCINLKTQKCYITSQNHGYAVDEDSLGEEWEVTYRNLNDQSVEGIAHKTLPYSAVQFHPEASPGPTDTCWLLNSFCDAL